MMMALAARAICRCARARRRDAAADRRRGRRQGADDRRALRPRRAHAANEAAELGCRGLRHARAAAASSSARPRRAGGGRGARARALPHSALAPSGQPVWLEHGARARPARCRTWPQRGLATQRHPHRRRASTTRWSSTRPSAARPTCCCTCRRSPTPRACGAHRRGLGARQPRRAAAWSSVLPNGPVDHPTVRVFLAGGVPEVMLHLRDLGLLRLDALTVHRRAARRRARLVGAQRAAHARARAAASSATASTPTR